MVLRSNICRLSRKAIAVIAAVALAASLCLPVVAWAAQPNVSLENRTLDRGQSASDVHFLSGLVIDGVDAPRAGEALDDTAHVTSDQGFEWDIPVLWVDANLQLATQSQQGVSCLPVLAFFVPDGYALQGDTFTVRLSDSLVRLFGTDEIVSIYDARTGITYTLPSSIRGFFAPASTPAEVARDAAAATPTTPATTAGPAAPAEPTWIEIYCAQTAIEVLSEDDLNFLLDLVINKLQPQAVELLIAKFPAFAEAADANQLGRSISLYVYFIHGDKDGLPEHETVPENSIAYVAGDAIDRGGVKYCYMIGLDTSVLLEIDDEGKYVRDDTGRYILVRTGEAIETLKNTIVHEMLHAFMDDYNRTGTMGGTNPNDVVTDRDGIPPTEELAKRYQCIVFPRWFTEGAASSIENVYQYRYNNFKLMREATPGARVYETWFDQTTFLVNYLNGKLEGKPLYADLCYSIGYDENENRVDNTQSAYVMGYVATLYLSELMARATTGSAVWTDGMSTSVSSDALRMGLNNILKELHEGATLDQVISEIAPVAEDGTKPYNSADEFESIFIKGAPRQGDLYSGDEDSLAFAVTLLNYLQAISMEGGRKDPANGSILFDFNDDYTAPLDETKNVSSDFFKIVKDNQMVESTVPNDVALRGGGKSDPDAVKADEPADDASANAATQQAAKEQEASEQGASADEGTAALPLAAKTPSGQAGEATAGDAAGEKVVEAAAPTGK